MGRGCDLSPPVGHKGKSFGDKKMTVSIKSTSMSSDTKWRLLLLVVFISAFSLDTFAQSRRPPRPRPTPAPIVQPQVGPLKNTDIVRLGREKLSEAVIISVIQSSETDFDVSLEAIIQLKRSGVSDVVIGAMQQVENLKRNSAQSAQKQESNNNKSEPQKPALPTTEPTNLTLDDSLFFARELSLTANRILATESYSATPVKVEKKAKNFLDLLAGDFINRTVENASFSAATSSLSKLTMAPMGNNIFSQSINGMAWDAALGAVIGVQTVDWGWILERPFTMHVTYTLPKQASVFVAEGRKPRIEMVFHNIPEFDPDEYTPIMMLAQGTKRNTRIVFSNQCSCYAHPRNRKKNKFETLEIGVPLDIEVVQRGQLIITPKTELEIGEYAITWISKRDGTTGARLGLWTFSVRQ